MEAITLKSFAKINPYLAVGSKRPDGYHELHTRFQLISLHDTVSLHPAEHLSIECNLPELAGDRNLCAKALRLLSEAVELPKFKISIEKHIPLQAGLGGGSSNAGTLLRCLNRLTGRSVAESDIHAIALACGADVPFFLSGKAASWAHGIGELLETCEPLDEQWICLAQPDEKVSTADAYQKLDAIAREPITRSDEFCNDFELVAPQACLRLLQRLTELGAHVAHLCGSGSAVFGFANSQDHANEMAAELAKTASWCRVAKCLSQQEAEEQWMSSF